MGKFVLAYKGGSGHSSDEEGAKVMAAWMGWFATLGAAILDGGNPFGASTTVASDGSMGAASAGLSGYSIVSADDLSAAATLAKGCPILDAGGSVEVYEAIPM